VLRTRPLRVCPERVQDEHAFSRVARVVQVALLCLQDTAHDMLLLDDVYTPRLRRIRADG
jgi:hypothetical protein